MIWMPGLSRASKRKGDFDLVVAGVLPYDVFLRAGLRFGRVHRIPFIAWPMLHLGLGQAERDDNPFLIPERMEVVRQADHVLVNTEAEIPTLEIHGIARDRISVGGLGVNPQDVTGGNGARIRDKYGISAPIVLQLSKQIVDKGSQHTVEAMKRLWESGIDATLILAGQTTDNFDSFWFQQPGDVLERTILLDYVSAEEKRDLLDAADIFLMPSKADSFGIVYLEAWLYKKPVIGAFAGGVPALIRDGQDGLLVPYGDSHFLAETILQLLQSRELRQKLGQSGYRRTLQEFTWETQYRKTFDVYQQVVSQSKKP